MSRLANRKRVNNIRHSNREYYIQMLGGSCIGCGTTKRLHFDHINPNSKSFDISQRLDYDVHKVTKEVKKCQLLYVNCHCQKTIKDRGFNKSAHGTPSMYSNKRCRCELCKEAWRGYLVPRLKIYRSRATV